MVSATRMTPRGAPSHPTYTAVAPSRARPRGSDQARAKRAGSPDRRPAEPTATVRAVQPATSGRRRPARQETPPAPRATGHDGPGDRVLRPHAPPRRPVGRTRVGIDSPGGATAPTVIMPVVTVPVLSSTTVSMRRVDSST